MTEIPMCWKCKDAIKEAVEDCTGATTLVGCRESDNIKDYTTAQKHCPLIRGRRACTSCGKEKDDVRERYSAGFYAGRLCVDCCSKYRDNCGVNGEEQTPVEELDEFAFGGYDAVYGEEGSLL